MCLNDQVRVVSEVGPTLRPNSSHPVAWIRRHDTPTSVAYTEGNIRWLVHPPRSGVIVVSIRFVLRHMYVPSEMNAYPAAQARIVRHERGHIPAWETGLSAHVGLICTTLEQQITGSVTVQAVHDLVQSLQPQRYEALERAATGWDTRDYPGLRRDLAGMGAEVMAALT